MRTKFTLGLLFLNVALFFYIFYVDRGPITGDAGHRLFGPEASNIQSLQIDATGGGQLRIEHRPDGWFLTKPFEWPANEFAVRRIINELQLLESESSFAVADVESSGQSLADYGLADPRVTLTFSSAPVQPDESAPPPVQLRIGSDTAVDNRLYILSPDGTRIHVVRRSLADSLMVALPELRAETIFTIPVFEVRSFNLKAAGANGLRVRLRRENARWMFEAPVVTRASKTATEVTINDLNALRTKSFVPPAEATPENTGLDASAMRITLEGNNRRETLLLGKPTAPPAADANATEFFAQLEDRSAVFRVSIPSRLYTTLTSAQEKLRDPTILDFDPATVTGITLSAGPTQTETTLQRLDSGPGDSSWQIVRRGGAPGLQTIPADRTLVEHLLQRLALLKAEKFYSDAPSAEDLENLGFNRPDRTITLNYLATPLPGGAPQQSSVTLQLSLGNRGDSTVYAKLVNQSFVYTVSPDTLNAIPVAARVYRDRDLRSLPAGASIRGLSLSAASGGEVRFTHTLAEGETWDQFLATLPDNRRAAIAAILASLRDLRASAFVRDDFPPTITIDGQDRPWTWRLDATLMLSGGDGRTTTSTLFFSDRTGGTTQFAGSPDLSVVFVPEQSLVDALWTLTYGDRDPGPPPETAP